MHSPRLTRLSSLTKKGLRKLVRRPKGISTLIAWVLGGIYLFKVSNENFRTICEICLWLTLAHFAYCSDECRLEEINIV